MKTVIEMAMETLDRMAPDNYCLMPYWTATDEELQAFAALVRADEREACAKVCDDIDAEYKGEDVLATWCSRAIRSRGDSDEDIN